MIEIPAAALALRFHAAAEFPVDRTNDLIQYTLAIDRTERLGGPPLRPLTRRS